MEPAVRQNGQKRFQLIDFHVTSLRRATAGQRHPTPSTTQFSTGVGNYPIIVFYQHDNANQFD
jgi:hypothetical protein